MQARDGVRGRAAFSRGGQRVLLYRSTLLPRSETFVAAQVGALRRYEAIFVGLARAVPSLPLAAPPLLALPAERLLYLKTGWAPRLLRQARAARASLMHAHFALDAAEALPLAAALAVPLVVTLHGFDVMCDDATHAQTRRGRRYLARRAELWRQAAAFVCVSGAIRDQAMRRGFPEARLKVLPIGIDVEALQLRSGLGADGEVLFVGRLVEKKGCAVLLEAMRQVQAALPAVRLTIVGEGPERERLERLAAERFPRTTFVGAQTPEQVRQRMREARCLAAPSLTAADGDAEGLPTVLMEAMALGLPVASTRHSGIPELILDGEHGLLGPEADAASLASNLLRLCTEDGLAARLRQAARARVVRFFNLVQGSRLLEELYDEVSGTERWVGTLAAAAVLSEGRV